MQVLQTTNPQQHSKQTIKICGYLKNTMGPPLRFSESKQHHFLLSQQTNTSRKYDRYDVARKKCL